MTPPDVNLPRLTAPRKPALRFARTPALLLVAIATIVTGGACRETTDKVPPGVLARVGPRMVSVEEFKHYLQRNTGTELAQISPVASSALLDQYVNEVLLSEYAAAKGLDVDAEKVTEAVRNDPGSTLTEKRDQLRRARVMEELTEAVDKPGDDKVRAFYTEHESEFQQEEQARVRQILVRDEATAKKVQSELRAGVPFEELSKQYSTAPNADRGGEIGFIARGQLPPIFEQAIFSLGAGQVSDIVASDNVFLIFKVVERSPAGAIPFDEARESIRIRLEAEQLDRKVSETIGQAGKQFPVTILTKRIPFPYTGAFPRAANE